MMAAAHAGDDIPSTSVGIKGGGISGSGFVGRDEVSLMAVTADPAFRLDGDWMSV